MKKIAQTFRHALGKKTVQDAVMSEHIETRALATQKIGRTLRDVTLTEADSAFAEKLLILICKDVSDVVRRALSVTLQNSPNLPHGVAQKLIQDLDSIAVPVLKNSPVITDEDLLQILKSKAATKVKAIAQRRQLSAHISKAIISFGDSAAVADLAANDSALIAPDVAEQMATIYADDDLIRDAALSRQDMPPAVVQKLINAATRKVEQNLERVSELSQLDRLDITNRTQERVLLNYIDRDWPEKTLIAYVQTLKNQNALTEDLILRAAGIGDIRFVQIALAKMSGISPQKCGELIYDSGPLGLAALARRAELSDTALHFLRAALTIFRDFQSSGRVMSAKEMQKLMLERILTLPLELSPEMENDLCEKLDSLSHLSVVA